MPGGARAPVAPGVVPHEPAAGSELGPIEQPGLVVDCHASEEMVAPDKRAALTGLANGELDAAHRYRRRSRRLGHGASLASRDAAGQPCQLGWLCGGAHG